jgi:acyl carrier protein
VWGAAEPVALANDPVRAARRRTAVAALRGHVLERLPGYLVPAHVMVLDSWPLDRAGRLDRAALPRPAARAAADLAAREPRTDTERAIAKIWADALGVDTIGVHEDFFSLGGHSLLGAEVVELVRDVYEVDLPLGRLFEAPTVAAVAEYVDKALAAPSETVTVASGGIERIDRGGDYRTRRARTVGGGRS